MTDPVVDGSGDFLGGQDASKTPDKIAENAYAAGVNVSVKDGCISPRWGFDKLTLIFPDGSVTDALRRQTTYEELFKSGKFQALIPYQIGDTKYSIIVISGFIFLVNLSTLNVEMLSVTDSERINSRADRINWSEAGRFIVLHDFPHFPVIIDGIEAKRSTSYSYGIPVSTMSCFNQSRLFIANNGNEFTGGDPVGAGFPDAPVTFEEVLTGTSYLGQIFQLPTGHNNEPITAMGFLQVIDSSTGIGSLLVGTEKAVYAYQAQQPRVNWETSQFGSIVVNNAGIAGARSIVNVNSDAMFISPDGHVRTLSMSRNEQSKWARVPFSLEVQNWINSGDKELQKYSFAGYFNNKVFFSVNPFRTSAIDYKTKLESVDYAFGGMVVLELDGITGFGQSGNPAWAGLWTGVHPMAMINVGDSAYIMSKDRGFENALYRINPNSTVDTDGARKRLVRSIVYTREYDFKSPFEDKSLSSMNLSMAGFKGDMFIDVGYKPSHAPAFQPWRTFTYSAPVCSDDLCSTELFKGLSAHTFKSINIGSPEADDTCNPITADYYTTFKKLQLKFIISGEAWQLDGFRINAAMGSPDLNITTCEEYPSMTLEGECNNDWYFEGFNQC